MKILIVCVLCIISTIAEPPVESRYLPPQQGGNFGAPSSTYGVPGSSSGGSHGRQTSAIFGGRQSGFSRTTSRRPSSQYGAPSAGFSRTPSNEYGPPSTSFSTAPSSQYGAPSASFSGSPSSQYGAPSAQFGGAPSIQYGAPSPQYGAPDVQARQLSSQYGVPSQGGARGFSSQLPSQQYGAPGTGSIGDASGYAGAESRQYLPPGGAGGRGGYGGDDGNNGEPANYSFEYMVKDQASGNDFGHRESRQGERAEGLYYVLLPDGRKQTVEYEADQGGYRPRISYEDTGAGGYSGSQGYGGQGGPY